MKDEEKKIIRAIVEMGVVISIILVLIFVRLGSIREELEKANARGASVDVKK
jgi:competence protein ComGC